MTVGARAEKQRTFFVFSFTSSAIPARLTLVNESEFVGDGSEGFYLMSQKLRGFARYRTGEFQPSYEIGNKNVKIIKNVEPINSFLLITGAVKIVLESVDPTAFDFIPIILKTKNGDNLLDYWLCDVVRIIDALDEKNSDVIIHSYKPKIYYLGGADRLIFKDDVVGRHHIFRMAHSERTIICDDVMRRACVKAKVRGLAFYATIVTRKHYNIS